MGGLVTLHVDCESVTDTRYYLGYCRWNLGFTEAYLKLLRIWGGSSSRRNCENASCSFLHRVVSVGGSVVRFVVFIGGVPRRFFRSDWAN